MMGLPTGKRNDFLKRLWEYFILSSIQIWITQAIRNINLNLQNCKNVPTFITWVDELVRTRQAFI